MFIPDDPGSVPWRRFDWSRVRRVLKGLAIGLAREVAGWLVIALHFMVLAAALVILSIPLAWVFAVWLLSSIQLGPGGP